MLRVGTAAVAGAALLAVPGGAAAAASCRHPGHGAAALSCHPVAVDRGWRRGILDVAGPYVRPVSVAVEGDRAAVGDPEGLLREGGGATTLTTTAAGSTRLVVDLGLLASGHVELGVRRAAGARIRMSYAEGRQYLGTDGDADTDPDGFFYRGATLGTDDDPDGRSDVFDPPADAMTLTSPGIRGSQRYIAITLDGAGSAAVDFVRVHQTNYTGAYDGHFLSSDTTLNQAWYASAYALDLSTTRDTRTNPRARWVTVDGPKRDRVVYAGDLQLVAQAAYYQGGRYRQIMRDSINLFACQQQPDGSLPAASRIDVPCDPRDPGPPDGSPTGFPPPGDAGLVRLDSFTALWVVGLDDYLRYSGDGTVVRAMLPVARRAVAFFAAHTDGGVLWRTDTYAGKPGYNWHPPDVATGVDTYGNEAYYAALRSVSTMERAVGAGRGAADRLDQRAGQVRTALLATLWDTRAGAMVLNTEDPSHDHTADANAGALAFGLLDARQAASAMRYLATTLATPYGTMTTREVDNPYMTRFISPYLLGQEALGRFRYGDGTGALRLIRTGWGHLLRSDPGLPWEQEGPDGTPNGVGTHNGNGTDLAHAWSTAVPALSMDVLGVTPASPGYHQWSVAPDPVDLTWAQGDVPLPGGKHLSVRWKRDASNRSFVLTVTAPAGTRGSISVPQFGAVRTIAVDGRIGWTHGHAANGATAHRSGDTVVFTGISGTHTLAWSA
jgi:alpha-L-rhamnosidase